MSIVPGRTEAPWRAAPVELVAPRARKLAAFEDYFFAFLGVLLVVVAFVWASEEVRHWYLIPVSLCGILGGVDAVRWLRGRMDIFDPQTLVGLLAFYGFFVAPMLHVVWDRFGMGYDLNIAGDNRVWLGWMAWLNAAGLLLLRLAAGASFRHAAPAHKLWRIDPLKATPIMFWGLLLSLSGMVLLLWNLGGIWGVISAFQEARSEVFVGTGWMLVLAWPLSILSLIAITVWMDKTGPAGKHPGLIKGLFLLSAIGIAHFLLMGWRGSRSTTVWAAFWMAGIIHYKYRRFSPRLVALGTILVVSFLYFYGFYKEAGTRGFEVLASPQQWLNPEGYRRDLKGLLLGDLARADTQSYILYSLTTAPGDYDYRWGLTYLGGFSILIPRNIWPDRPEFKVEAGTEAQYGKTSRWRSSRVYGLGGEAMLNFGPLGVPVAFAIYGGVLGWYRRKLQSWRADDARLFLAPFFAILFAIAFTGDSDNVVFAAITQGTLVFLCLRLSSKFLRMHPVK